MKVKKAKGNKEVSTSKPKSEELVKLGNRIKFLRQKKGYTNYEYFAYENNIPRSQYGRYEKGEDMRFSSLVKVVKGLGMTLPEFFGEGFD